MARAATATVRLLTGEREPVRVATTANISLSGLQTIDGVLLDVGDRVLVKNQTDAKTNGIYTASEGVWYRASDARSARTIQKGVTVHVAEGTTQATHVYSFQTLNPDLGSDNIVLAFQQSDDTLGDVNAAVAAGVVTVNEAGAINIAAAAAHAATAEQAKDDIERKLLGVHPEPPTTDNDGNPIEVGALYYDSTLDALFTWDGDSWVGAEGPQGPPGEDGPIGPPGSGGLPNVEDWRGHGGDPSDIAALQAAHNETGLAGGGTVIVPKGVYSLGSTLLWQYGNVYFQGQGSGGIITSKANTRDSAATRFEWVGTPNTGSIVKVTSNPADDGTTFIKTGGGLSRIMLDGNENVLACLEIQTWFGFEAEHIHACWARSYGYKLWTLKQNVAAGTGNTLFTKFTGCIYTELNTAQSPVGLLMTTRNPLSNVCYSQSLGMQLINSGGGVSIILENCDNNVFSGNTKATGGVIFHSETSGTVAQAAANGSNSYCRYNKFEVLEADTIIAKEKAGAAAGVGMGHSQRNVIDTIQYSNGAGAVTREAGAILYINNPPEPASQATVNIGLAGSTTIAGGVITATYSNLRVDTQGGAATDNLDTINGMLEGDILYLRAFSPTRDVVVKNGTGNIHLPGGDFTLSVNTMGLLLVKTDDAGGWVPMGKGN